MSESLLRTNKEITEIYDRHVTTVYRICFMFLKNIPDAEDATQSVFRKLIEYEKQFQSLEHEKSWLIVTAQNHCRNALKNWWHIKRDHSEHSLENSFYEDTPYSDIWEQLFSLQKKYSIVIYLYYYEGYKTDEIADILKENASTIRTRLNHGRKKLRIIMEGM